MSNILINFLISIFGAIAAGVVVLIIEYWVIQPIKNVGWLEKQSFRSTIKFFGAILSLIIPVLLIRDYLVTIMSYLPTIGDTRLNLYATMLAVIATIWGVIWGTLIRPRLL